MSRESYVMVGPACVRIDWGAVAAAVGIAVCLAVLHGMGWTDMQDRLHQMDPQAHPTTWEVGHGEDGD